MSLDKCYNLFVKILDGGVTSINNKVKVEKMVSFKVTKN